MTLKSRFQVFYIRLVWYRWKRERVLPGRVGGIVSGGAMNRQELFSPLIVGLELFVRDGPSRRDSFFVREPGKIFFSKAGKRRAIHLRVAAYEIMNPG